MGIKIVHDSSNMRYQGNRSNYWLSYHNAKNSSRLYITLFAVDIIDVEGATGNEHSDFLAKMKAALDALQLSDTPNGRLYNFGFLHIKAVDEASHDGNFALKRHLLQKIDSMVALLYKERQDPVSLWSLSACIVFLNLSC